MNEVFAARKGREIVAPRENPGVDERLKEVYRTIGWNVARLRGAMSQDDLAQKAGVSRTTIYAVEKGDGCSLPILIKLAAALGVEPADLFITEEQERRLSYMTVKLFEKLSDQLKK